MTPPGLRIDEQFGWRSNNQANGSKTGSRTTLESAAIVPWPDLVHEGQTGLIHIEQGFAPAAH